MWVCQDNRETSHEGYSIVLSDPGCWDDGKNWQIETSTTSAIGQTAEVNEIDHLHFRQVYHMKYSQAKLSVLPMRKSFVEAVSYQITEKQHKDIPSCPKCFSSLILGTNY